MIKNRIRISKGTILRNGLRQVEVHKYNVSDSSWDCLDIDSMEQTVLDRITIQKYWRKELPNEFDLFNQLYDLLNAA